MVNELNAPINRPNVFHKEKEELKQNQMDQEKTDRSYNIETDRVEDRPEEAPKNSLPSSSTTRFK